MGPADRHGSLDSVSASTLPLTTGFFRYPNFKDPCILDDTGIYKAKEDEYWVQKYLIRDSRGITKPPKGTGWKAFKRTTRGGKGRKKK